MLQESSLIQSHKTKILSLVLLPCLLSTTPRAQGAPNGLSQLERNPLSLSYDFDEALKRNWTGLKLEKKKDLISARKQLELVLDYKVRNKKNSLLTLCGSYKDEIPLACFFLDAQDTGALEKPITDRKLKSAVSREQIVEWIGSRTLNNLAPLGFTQLNGALSSVDNLETLNSLHSSFLQDAKCNSPGYSTALALAIGARYEDEFPRIEAIEKSRSAYLRASDCGQDQQANKARFRGALLSIWLGQFDKAQTLLDLIEASSSGRFLSSRVKYWRYVCAQKLNLPETQFEARESLLRQHPLSYHNLLINGSDQRMQTYLSQNKVSRVGFRSNIRPDLNDMIRLSELLIEKKEFGLALEILDKHEDQLTTLEPEVRLYLALLVNRTGNSIAKFKMMTALFQDEPQMVTPSTLKLVFPIWFLDKIKSRAQHVDPFLILSLIRQESAFNRFARSGVGARGLMQVMPETARGIASVKSSSQLYDPETNIRVGVKYFLHRLENLDGDIELTLAAYNAGFNRVEKWKKRYTVENRVLLLDLIPYSETRDYVASILRNYYWYLRLYQKDLNKENSEKFKSIVEANLGSLYPPKKVNL